MSRSIAKQDSLVANAEFQLLRAYIEREIPERAVVLVTSAKAGDGKSLTAYSLADCLARSGRRTALVDATAKGSLALPPAERGNPDLDLAVYVPMPKPQSPLSREATRQFVEEVRSSHEFTIIDSAALLSNEMAMALAQAVDGVLLAVRVGRAPSDIDELTVRMLDRTGARVLGVVAAAPQAIDRFDRRRTAGAQTGVLTGARPARSGGMSWLKPVRRVLVGILATVALTLGAGVASSSAISPAPVASAIALPAAPATAALTAPLVR
jgi:CobQ/CobB/MinD/ParA nucleotide binding domain